MATQLYGTVASRNLLRAEQTMLKHAGNIMVLGKFGAQKQQPLRKTDTIVFRRLKPFNATAAEVPNITAANFVTAEGVTPNPNTISYTDVSVTLQQYAVLFKFSSKAELMYEDDIPEDMATSTGETLGEVAELVCYGQIKSGSTVVYANGTTLVGVNSVVSLNRLRLCARTLESNRAKRVTKAIKPGPNFGTSAVEATYIVFHHTDCNADVRELAGFIKKEEYGTAITPVHPREIGACEEFRFVTSPLFSPALAAGAPIGVTGCYAADDTTLDVYPMIVTAQDAWGHVSLKGHKYTGISPTMIPSNVKNHANPSGMFGFVGADFWYNAVRLNENWMVALKVCVTEL